MNTFIWIGAFILLLCWIGLMIFALSYQFKEDEQNKLHLRFLPKAGPDNPLKTVTPE
jgi:hypothetical protein